jgi:glutamate racemase
MRPATVGVFDSGVGGLSVWREIARQLPHADLIYVADQAHCPYGLRSRDEVRDLSTAIAAFLIARGADVVVVACNTASAAALYVLRERFDVPIVGMEPAVKPAAARTRSGHVGVIATQVTFQGELFASLLERFAHRVTVHTQVCPGLVEQVEAGKLEDEETLALVRRYLAPLLGAGVDMLVLGCTHYAFLRPLLARVAGEAVGIIDPASAVARQAGRVLAQARPNAPRDRQGKRTLYTSGDAAPFEHAIVRLLGSAGDVQALGWDRSGRLVSFGG